jgi:NACalpha-BTF3-like transcription factor
MNSDIIDQLVDGLVTATNRNVGIRKIQVTVTRSDDYPDMGFVIERCTMGNSFKKTWIPQITDSDQLPVLHESTVDTSDPIPDENIKNVVDNVTVDDGSPVIDNIEIIIRVTEVSKETAIKVWTDSKGVLSDAICMAFDVRDKSHIEIIIRVTEVSKETAIKVWTDSKGVLSDAICMAFDVRDKSLRSFLGQHEMVKDKIQSNVDMPDLDQNPKRTFIIWSDTNTVGGTNTAPVHVSDSSDDDIDFSEFERLRKNLEIEKEAIGSTVDMKDVDLIMKQVDDITRYQAITALIESRGDLVNAIMSLNGC